MDSTNRVQVKLDLYEVRENLDQNMSNYKEQYRLLKGKLKFLIYENECFHEALRSTQRQLLKVNRDKIFLLDRLLHYERANASLIESDDETNSSDDGIPKIDTSKRRKTDSNTSQSSLFLSVATKSHNSNRKKIPIFKSFQETSTILDIHKTLVSDGHMTPEEVERHLESRQNYLELVPEKAPPTVPTEMFSNDTSLDKSE